MAFQNIFILGSTGNVGKELIHQIGEHDMSDKGHLNPTRIVGLANSNSYTLNPEGIATPELTTLYGEHEEILKAVKKSGLEGEVIFVDVSAEGPKMLQLHQKIIQETTNKIVTANKKPLVGSMQSFQAIASNPARYLYNTSVMAGAAAVPYLQEVHGLGETVHSIQGTFSGTLAYVCFELGKGERKFSEIVQDAKDKGYTEPNPLDDLSGEDVKRKLMILLRSAGISVEEDGIILEAVVSPEKYGSLSPEDFMAAIAEEDAFFSEKIRTEGEKGNVPRYVASYRKVGDTQEIKVGLQFVPRDSELGILKGTANKILICTSQRTPDICNPHTIQSPGAGVVKTAASVRSDLLHLLNNTNLYIHN